MIHEVKSNRRKGNRERASKASMDLEDLEVDLVLKKKYLKRFTKMMLGRELSSFVKQEMTILLSALSSYAAASAVTCQQLQKTWEDAGEKMCSNFPAMIEQSQTNYNQMKDRLIREQLQQWERKESESEESESESESESEESESEESESESESEKNESESEEESSESSEEEKPKKSKKSKKSKRSKKDKKSKRKEESDESSSEVAL